MSHTAHDISDVALQMMDNIINQVDQHNEYATKHLDGIIHQSDRIEARRELAEGVRMQVEIFKKYLETDLETVNDFIKDLIDFNLSLKT